MTGAPAGTRLPGAGATPLPLRVLSPIARVIGSVALTFLGLLLVTFLIGRVVPIDPVLAAVGDRAPAAVYERVKEELGLNLPLWQQFWIYLKKVLAGDLGRSVLTSNLVLVDIRRFFPATLSWRPSPPLIGVTPGDPDGRLRRRATGPARRPGRPGGEPPSVIGAGFLARAGWGSSSSTGGLAGWRGRVASTWPSRTSFPTVTGVIMVDSVLAGEWEVFWNALSHVILPASILGYLSFAYLARMTRSFMLAELGQEYVTTARIKGLTERRVVWRRAFGNVMVPLITVVALAYANLLEGSVLTKTVFAWPGLGQYIRAPSSAPT